MFIQSKYLNIKNRNYLGTTDNKYFLHLINFKY